MNTGSDYYFDRTTFLTGKRSRMRDGFRSSKPLSNSILARYRNTSTKFLGFCGHGASRTSVAACTAYGNVTTTLSLVYFAVPGETFVNAPLSEEYLMAVKVEPAFGGTLVL